MEITKDGYKVDLTDIYSGPLDLLLYLVKKDEITIHEISISKITEQYLEYIELLQMLDVNIAAEFLVMAATLMHIKSHSLLPTTETLEDDDENDPQFELIQQLLEYKKYKDLALALNDKRDEVSKKFARPKINFVNENEDDLTLDLGNVSIWDLLEKFSNLMKQTLLDEPSLIKDDDKPVSKYMDELIFKIQNTSNIYFHDLFNNAQSRMAMLGYFLALLELVRLKKLKVQQEATFDRIKISNNLEIAS